MPGFGRGDWQETYQALQAEGVGEDHSIRLIETPVFSRTPIRRGIDYNLEYGAFNNGGAPTIPYPIRSSLAQVILIAHIFKSHYFSWIRRGSPEQLDQMGIGHTFAKVSDQPYAMQTTALRQQARHPKPTLRRYGIGRVSKGGVMGAPPRFRKALRVIDVNYRPPVYGEESS